MPYSKDRGIDPGYLVEVTLPGGDTLSEEVVVEDLFVVAMGDSFASGEGNADARGLQQQPRHSTTGPNRQRRLCRGPYAASTTAPMSCRSA